MDNPILFCIPYAGGSSMSFINIINLINIEGLDIQCLELSGRGLRDKEPLPSSLDEVLDDLYLKVIESLDSSKRPILFWGHSMGAILALMLSSRLHKQGFDIAGLMVSGMKAPSFTSKNNTLSKNTRNQLFSDMLPTKHERNKETPLFKKVYKKRMEIMENDVDILEKHIVKNWLEITVPCTLAVIMGDNDELFPEPPYYQEWKLHTSGNTQWFSVKGGHFFIMQYPEKTAQILNQILNQILHKT